MDVKSDASVDATHNYWGDKSGPYHEKLNPSGQGNSVGGDGVNLDFIFFLTKPIGVINTRPTAVFLTDRILVPPNGNVVFFATDSFDTDGRVDRYIFNFGDGYSSGLTTLSVFEHRYSVQGTYYANLTVIDDYGTASDVVFETINVQNLPPLQVNVDLSNSAVHEGEQVTVAVHVTDGINAVENATIMMFSVAEGNFSQFSGLTNATGYFVANFTAPDIADKMHFRIVARASKTPYTEGTDYKYLEVSPFLSVQIDANPSTIKSEGISQVTVHALSNGEPVIGASVILSSTVGNLSSSAGVTNLNGMFSVVFTAPQTIVLLDSIVSATVTKEGYMSGAGQVTIVIEPKILNVIVYAQPDVTISEANVTLTAHVEYEMTPIESANVTVTAQSGDFSKAYDFSNEYGNVTFSFTTPPVSTQSKITITIRASETGYATGQSTIELTVNPRTFEIKLTGPDAQSEDFAAILVNVTCVEDGKPVVGANITISSDAGSFNVTSMLTNGQGICDFIFATPYTVVQIYVTVTANVTRNGYVDGGNQTQIVVNPKTVPPGEGGWPLMTILLILIPVIIAVIVIIVLIKFKVVTVSSSDTEEEA
jgi:PKD repeat protein